mgnify:CR=1 FL=1
MSREDGPLLQNFNSLPEGVIMQELTTYYVRDGIMIKETVERKYTGDDYMDTTSVQPLVKQ